MHAQKSVTDGVCSQNSLETTGSQNIVRPLSMLLTYLFTLIFLVFNLARCITVHS